MNALLIYLGQRVKTSCILECAMLYCCHPDLRSLFNMRQGILKIKFDNGHKNNCPLQGLGFCTQFKNAFAFLSNIVTDNGSC